MTPIASQPPLPAPRARGTGLLTRVAAKGGIPLSLALLTLATTAWSADPTTAPAATTTTAPATTTTTTSAPSTTSQPTSDTSSSNTRDFRSDRRDRNRSRSTPSGGNPEKILPPDYQVLAQKSMFSKDRRPRIEREPETPSTTPGVVTPPREILPIVRGAGSPEEVSLEDGPSAVLEMPDGSRLLLHVGDVVEGPHGGTVTDIDVAWIEITPKGSPARRILLGQDLAGGEPGASSAPSDPAAVSPGTPAATLPESGGPPPGMSEIEWKMRLKARQDRNR